MMRFSMWMEKSETKTTSGANIPAVGLFLLIFLQEIMKSHDNIKTENIQQFYLDNQDIVESSWPGCLYLNMAWVTCVFCTQPSNSLTGTLECTFHTLRAEDLETIWQPVSVKVICPPVHPPFPLNRVTPVYLYMISFLPSLLCCLEHCVILGCVITGSQFFGFTVKSI